MVNEKFNTLKILVGLTILFFSILFLLKEDSLIIKEHFLIEDLKERIVDSGTEIIREKDNGKPVFMSGVVRSSETLKDIQFNVEIHDALQLKRVVKTYQWQEKIVQNKKKRQYKYKKVWSEELINSNAFKFSNNYKNPKNIPFQEKLYDSKQNFIGVYSIPNYVLQKIWSHDFINVSRYLIDEKEGAPRGFKLVNGKFFSGRNINDPKIGDVLVEFYAVKPFEVTVVGMQNENKISHYEYQNKKVLIVKKGVMSLDKMFSKLDKEKLFYEILYNTIAFILITISLLILGRPFHHSLLKIPYFGEMIAYASKAKYVLISILLSTVITSLTWTVYKPIESLVAIGISFIVLIILREKGKI